MTLRQPRRVRAADDALRDAIAMLKDDNDDLSGLKERTDALRSCSGLSQRCGYRAADGFDRHAAGATAPVSGLETANRAGINVLVDDYWDLYQSLLQ